jgi:hypothetical protein
MRHFQQIAAGVDVLPLALDLYRAPELWNQHTARTDGDSPHREVDDIWCRFRPQTELIGRASYAEPFTPAMYPAWFALPHLRPLVLALMTRVESVQLGIVLITRIGPGKQAAPHDDRGRWAAEFFNLKVAVPLATNDGCYNTCEEEHVVMPVGSAWCFNNQVLHSTVNDGDSDRITLLLSMRVE